MSDLHACVRYIHPIVDGPAAQVREEDASAAATTTGLPALRRNALPLVRTLLTVGAIAYSISLLIVAFPAMDQSFSKLPWDTRDDWAAARAFHRHFDPYSAEGLRAIQLPTLGHPPTSAFWFLPLSELSLNGMSSVMGHFAMVLLLLHLLLIAHELAFPWPLAILSFALAMSSPWMASHFALAQVSELIAFLYLGAWYLLRRDREIAAGALIGLAGTFKFFPFVMVLPLALSRRWRGVASAAASFLAVAVLMTARFGWRSWLEFFALQRPTYDKVVALNENSSLHGLVARLFVPTCVGASPPVGPIPGAARALIAVSSVALLGAAAWLVRRTARRTETLDVSYGLFAMLSCFINPWVWDHYNVLFLLPLGIAVSAMLRERRRGLSLPASAVAAASLAVVVALWRLPTANVYLHELRRQYATHPTSDLHWTLHLHEASAWLPPVILIGLLAAIAWRMSLRRDDAA
jgi:hypothetical protein